MMRDRKKQRRVAILVAGMHRSGTSAVARVTSLLGYTLPKTLLAPNPGNESGYWESLLVNQLNDELLALAGVDWRAWQPLRTGWSKQAPVVQLRAKALSILECEFGAAQHFVLKDPRLCRLIGFWREVIETVEAEPVVVCPVRNPLEVAASLEKRNALVPELAHLIWLRYVLEAEFATRGMRRAFASYDGFLEAWRPVTNKIKSDLGVEWPRSPEEAANDIDSFLSSTYRHHVLSAASVIEDRTLPKRLRTTYAILDRWSRERESRRDLKTLDRIRLGLDKIPSELQPILTAGHVQMERARTLRIRFEREAPEQAQRDAEAKATAQQLADVMTQLADATRRLARRDAEANESATRFLVAKSELAEAARQIAQREAEANANKAQLEAARVKLDETARQLAQREAQANANEEQLRAVKVQLAETASQLVQRDAIATANAEQLRSVKAQLVQTEEKLLRREAEAIATTKQLKEVGAANLRLADEIRDLEAKLDRSHREMEKVRLDAAGLDAELHGIRSSVSWRMVQAVNLIARTPARILRSFGLRPEDRAVALVAASNLFDRDWYLAQNPDIAAAGIDAALHYLRHGAAEGRDPGPEFSTRWYLDRHEDVAAAGMNPLLHYLLHGMAEGRAVKPASAEHLVRSIPSALSIPTEPPVAIVEPLAFVEPQVAGTFRLIPKEFRRRGGHVSLELFGLIMGLAPIQQEANADEAWLAIAKPSQALVAFCRLLGIAPTDAIRWHVGDQPFDASAKLGTADPAAYPVIFLESASSQAIIADIWYINDRDLRVRFTSASGSGAGTQPCVASFYQYDLSSGGNLLRVGQSVVEGQAVEFCDLALANSFAPVLMAFAAAEGRLMSASLLPFPSLCRGGVHYGELCAVGKGPSYLETLQAVSRSLFDKMLAGFVIAPDFSVSRIEIDLHGAIGSERIFSTETLEWLAHIMRVLVRPANSASIASPRVRAYLEQILTSNPLVHSKDLAEQIAARERGGSVALTLPHDAVPSLHALTSHELHVPHGQACAVGSFVVADSYTLAPQWAVGVPFIGEELVALQPAHIGIGFPVLTKLSTKQTNAETRDHNGMPIAVRFCDSNDRHPASLIMPIAPDVPGPLLRRVASGVVGREVAISVVLAPNPQSNHAFAALLESLKLQTIGECVEIIAIVDPAQSSGNGAIESALRHFFSDRFRLITRDRKLGLYAELNRAADYAAGTFLLIAAANIALHDPRTLDTLRTMADQDNVASAGCVLLQARAQKKLQTVAFRSGGIFPSTLMRQGRPETVFSELDCLNVFRVATYPVVGNTSALFMVRTDIWRKLGGFDATRYPDRNGDIDYGVRALTAGYYHLCTSVVSAELYESDFRPSYSDEGFVLLALPHTLEAITLSASTIEALKP